MTCLSALFCIVCSLYICALGMVCSGVAGYINEGSMSVLYSLSLLCCDKLLNLLSFCKLFPLMAAFFVTCGVYPLVLNVSPSVLPCLLNGSVMLLGLMGLGTPLCSSGIVTNLLVFVLIFHVFSNLFMCSMAVLASCGWCLVLNPLVYMICVMSSAYIMFCVYESFLVSGVVMSDVYRLKSVGERQAPCGTPDLSGKGGPM